MTSQYTGEPLTLKLPRAVIVAVTAVRSLAMKTDYENSTTGFSKSSRRGGIAAVLQESTNIPRESKRICKTSADSKIHQLTARCAPRFEKTCSRSYSEVSATK